MRSQYCAPLSEPSQLRRYFQTWSFGQLQQITPRPRRSTRGVTNPTRHAATERSSMLFQLYLIACSNSLTTPFSLLLLAWSGLHDFYDEWFAMLGPKRQTAPVTLCLHSRGEYQSLHCGRRSSWEQNLLPTLFFYIPSRREIIFCLQSLSRAHYTALKRWKLTPRDNWEFCCNFQTERQTGRLIRTQDAPGSRKR